MKLLYNASLLFTSILVFGISETSLAQRSISTDWAADIAFLGKKLPELHPNFFGIRSRAEFDSGLQAITEQHGLSNLETAVRLQQLIASFGDAHTAVHWAQLLDTNEVLPLVTFWFPDGIYVLGTPQRDSVLLYKRIIRINGFPIWQVADSLATLTTKDNTAIIRKSVPELLMINPLLQLFGMSTRDSIVLTVEDRLNNQAIHSLHVGQISEIVYPRDTGNVPFYRQHAKEVFAEKFFPDDSIYYVQYNQCTGREIANRNRDRETALYLPYFRDFERSILETLKNKPVKKMIFDMRFNPGGNSEQGTELVRRIARFDIAQEPGHLFVVIGRRTFSSAILNVMDFRSMTRATLVGEATGGKPNHFGEVRSFKLPSSKLQVSYSTKYFQRSPNDDKSVIPDAEIETSFEDYLRGIDPVFEWIKNQ